MINPLKKFAKIYLSYNRSDRSTILVIGVLILVVLISSIVVGQFDFYSSNEVEEFKQLYEAWEKEHPKPNKNNGTLFSFDPNTISENKLDSLNIPLKIKNNLIAYRKANGKFFTPADIRKLYGMNDSIFENIKGYIKIQTKTTEKIVKEKPQFKTSGFFDPNSASENKFKSFGFNNFQIRNILSYRKKNGKFYNEADLLKIYGIDSTFFVSIKKHIRIEKQEKETNKKKSIKFLTVDLNTADSTELTELRGVGPVFASRIIKYRNLLGGYYSTEQLLEVYNFNPETLLANKKHLVVDTTRIKKIRINFANYSELLKHPYINKSIVNSIINHREKFGAIKRLEELKGLEPIDSLVFKKIRPYITCR